MPVYAGIHVHTDLRLKMDKIEVNLFFSFIKIEVNFYEY
jgi:hypothetical protein